MPDEKMKFNQEEVIQTIRFCNFLEFLKKHELTDDSMRCSLGSTLLGCQNLLGYIVLNQVPKEPKKDT